MVGDIEVGHIITTSTELHDKRVFDVMSPNGKSKGQGQIEFTDFQLIEVPSFINYLEGGLKISFAVAIDFTASNGNPAKRSSLHYIGNTNQYEKALFQVGSILEPYSHDQNFPTFGFGGVPKGERQPNHCFALNGNPPAPGIQGVHNIQQTYRYQLPNIQLAGPTFFGPVLDAFNSYVTH